MSLSAAAAAAEVSRPSVYKEFGDRAARQGSDSLLPCLTACADPVFDAARSLLRAWLTECFPERDEELVDVAADIAVRRTISHLVLPGADPRPTAERLFPVVLKVLR